MHAWHDCTYRTDEKRKEDQEKNLWMKVEVMDTPEGMGRLSDLNNIV